MYSQHISADKGFQKELSNFIKSLVAFSMSTIKFAFFENNTITDGGSTAPLYCWYHTEEKTIQDHKTDWKDVRDSRASIVGCQTSAFVPSARRLLHCFLLKLGNNYHRLQQTATNCHKLLKKADEELIKSWWRTDEELIKSWWRADEELIRSWWRTDEGLTKDWWRTDKELMKRLCRADLELIQSWWRIDKELTKNLWRSDKDLIKIW